MFSLVSHLWSESVVVIGIHLTAQLSLSAIICFKIGRRNIKASYLLPDLFLLAVDRMILKINSITC